MENGIFIESINSNIKAIIFDMDGVLVDSEPLMRKAALQILNEWYGIEGNHDDYTPFIGAGGYDYFGGVARKYGFDYSLELENATYDRYCKLVNEEIVICENLPGILSELKGRGFLLAVASSAAMIKVRANLDVAKIFNGYFDIIVTGSDVKNTKPDPEIYLKAAALLNVIPSECIVAEDSKNGIIAGISAGMKCLGILGTFSEEQLIDFGAFKAANSVNALLDL